LFLKFNQQIQEGMEREENDKSSNRNNSLKL
jgi:hypothetical protein